MPDNTLPIKGFPASRFSLPQGNNYGAEYKGSYLSLHIHRAWAEFTTYINPSLRSCTRGLKLQL